MSVVPSTNNFGGDIIGKQLANFLSISCEVNFNLTKMAECSQSQVSRVTKENLEKVEKLYVHEEKVKYVPNCQKE